MKVIPIIIIIIIICCFKTIYKTILNCKKQIDIVWIRKYVIKREIIRLGLSIVLIILSYFDCIYDKSFPAESEFLILSVLSIYIFMRSIIRIILVLSRNNWFEIKAAECLNTKVETTGSDMDSSSPSAVLKTNMGNFSFYGYGPSMFMSSNMKHGDIILVIRFRFRKTYMLIGISNTVKTNFLKKSSMMANS